MGNFTALSSAKSLSAAMVRTVKAPGQYGDLNGSVSCTGLTTQAPSHWVQTVIVVDWHGAGT